MYYQTCNAELIFTPMDCLPKVMQKPRLREEVMADIRSAAETYGAFLRMTADEQEALVQFCMGNRGLKITFDPFFRKIFHPELHPERLNRLISAILKQKVAIKHVLPREGIQLSDNSSLMIMDMLVELEDGSLVNVEIQRYGYYFPVKRSFCYASDLLVRQYAQLRDLHGKQFSYAMMRPVYVIVLMENSPKEFGKYQNTFLHRSKFGFESGLDLENLLNFIYIPLDIFREMPHNELGELEAWLYFLGSDSPVHIQRILEKYPFFEDLYKEIINFRFHPKEMIGMYSEALAIMDRNTVNLMIDDMKKETEELKEFIVELQGEAAKLQEESEKTRQEIEKAKQESEKAKQESEKAKQESEQAKQESEKAKQESEKAKQESEKAKQESEKAKQESEKEKQKTIELKEQLGEKEVEIARLRALLNQRAEK